MTKITSTVTQIIPEWIKNAAQLFQSEDTAEDEDGIFAEPNDRGIQDSPVAETLSSHSNTQTSQLTHEVPSIEEPVPSDIGNKKLAAIKIPRNETKELQNRVPVPPMTTIEVDDDGSSSSENTASSTSGCSSLVPSHQDNLQRLHLPKSSLDRLRQELMKTTDRYSRSATSTKEDSSNKNSSALWKSRSGVREFDASKFIASNSAIPFPVRTVTSPFYPGSTKFGGASARRVEMLTSSPYNLNQRKMAPVLRVRANETSILDSSSQDKMSSAARKILESMDRISSPLEVAKKMPLRGRPSLTDRGPVFTTSRLNTSQSLQPSNSGLSQITSRNTIEIPTTAKITKNQPSTAMSITSRLNLNVSNVDSSMSRSLKNSTSSISGLETNIVKHITGGGKIKATKSSGRIPIPRYTSNDVTNDVILPNVELPPPKNLPTFNFGLEKVEEVSLTKQKDEFIGNNCIEDIKFSPPLVRSRDKPSETISDTFGFSSPKFLGEKPSTKLPSDVPNESPKIVSSWGDKFKSSGWNCPVCMVSNGAECSKCVCCEALKP